MAKQKESEFIPLFKIYKEGVTTTGPVTIMKKKGTEVNEAAKREKFLYLGYQILELNEHIILT